DDRGCPCARGSERAAAAARRLVLVSRYGRAKAPRARLLGPTARRAGRRRALRAGGRSARGGGAQPLRTALLPLRAAAARGLIRRRAAAPGLRADDPRSA